MASKRTTLFLICSILVIILVAARTAEAKGQLTLEDAWQIIKTKRFVDLTHAFAPGSFWLLS